MSKTAEIINQAKETAAKQYCYPNHNPYENFNSAIIDCAEHRKTKQLNAIIDKAMEFYHTTRLSEVSGELPDEIKVKQFISKSVYNTDSIPQSIEVASWMKAIASEILAKRDEKIAYIQNMHNEIVEAKDKEIAELKAAIGAMAPLVKEVLNITDKSKP